MNNFDPYDKTQDEPENPISPVDAAIAEHPQRIGRYRIEKLIGKGGFGIVYLAHDERLNRHVAVKVPHAKLISKPEDVEAYLSEARTVANLDHPGIVPVYDVGSTENFPCYIVSKYIPGTDLATKIKQNRLKYREAAEIVATVAEALHYAHKQGLVHRDVKPSNILIGKDDKPFVVDFGLALREGEEKIGKGPKYAGTPAYMSPEQARGEGHRVDGRSDVFSVGVVFYELLAGRQPFRGDTRAELLEQVTSYEERPLRQYDEKLPKELERICHKAMAKRANDRYSSVHDLAEDLRHFLTEQSLIQSNASPGGISSVASETHASNIASTAVGSITASSALLGTGSSDSQPIKIVPKGLRSFDAHDADFFLELLPGPRDRNGLPDSLRFWKTRIEETDPENTFKVGLIYGPSGCGKSSLVKAGLLPRLPEEVIAVYIEATPEETEIRLLHGLRKRCPTLEDNLTLKETLSALRRGQGIPVGNKVLIVLDQFEQWLHAKKEQENTDLSQALRQCDGEQLQCLVLVRDDFWMAATRFMRELEIRLLEAQNSAAVDLFPIRHAEKVLAAFGRAFGVLPDSLRDVNNEQKSFLTQSIAGLADEGKVICVRLALFAEMMKGKSWTPTALKEVGGTEGVGVTFLEETFSASTSPPEHRYHQKAARAVLKCLLPDSGSNIKGYMRSYAELWEVSGYANRPKDFDDLLKILDSEIRLITPTDPEGKDTDNDSVTQTQAGQRYFQLAHDYLVPSLRDWLTRKQRETRTGRAELKLAERTSAWNSLHESKQLPTLGEWISISTLTDRNRWTNPQRMLMQQASRFHLRQLTATVLLVGVFIVAGLWTLAHQAKRQEATRIAGLVGSLLTAEPNQLTDIIKELDANPQVAATYLSPLVSTTRTTPDEKREQLHARLATLSRDATLLEPLVEELLTGKVTYVAPICQQLRPSADQLTDRFRVLLRDEKTDSQRRFRAALALAYYVPESDASLWTESATKFISQQLVASNPEFQPLLRDLLRPIQTRLLVDIERIFGDPQATDVERLGTANAFADYAKTDIEKLSHLLTVATPEQFALLYPIVATTPASGTVDELGRIAATLPADDLGSAERIVFGRRRANAAVTLLRFSSPEKVLPVFEITDDPEALTQFIFQCRSRGVRVEELLELLKMVTQHVSVGPSLARPSSLADSTDYDTARAHYAILLAMGEYTLDEVPQHRRESLVNELADIYRNNPSSGVHGATGWLLRNWGQGEVVREVDQTAVPYSTDREWFTLNITVMPTPSSEANTEPLISKSFYYTFCVFPAGDYKIGSLPDEVNREKREEDRHVVKLTRPFAVLNREVTLEELVAFSPKQWLHKVESDVRPEVSGFSANWYDAVAFCRWLTLQSGMDEVDQAYADPAMLDQDQYPREPNPGDNWAPRNWQIQQTQRGFRLMTESEWEVASRAGCRTTFSYGSEAGLLDRFGWFADNSGHRVHPPSELRPSLRGLFDIHGNLAEWTHDWFLRTEGTTVDPRGANYGSYRVIRGGGWRHIPAYCRSSSRSRYDPTNNNDYFGIRLALSPAAKSPEAKHYK